MTTRINFSLPANATNGASVSVLKAEPAVITVLNSIVEVNGFEQPSQIGPISAYGALYVRPGDIKGLDVSATQALVIDGPAPSLVLTSINAAVGAGHTFTKPSPYSHNTATGGGIEGNVQPIPTPSPFTYAVQTRTRTARSAVVPNQLQAVAPVGSENVTWTTTTSAVTVNVGASVPTPELGPDQRILILGT